MTIEFSLALHNLDSRSSPDSQPRCRCWKGKNEGNLLESMEAWNNLKTIRKSSRIQERRNLDHKSHGTHPNLKIVIIKSYDRRRCPRRGFEAEFEVKNVFSYQESGVQISWERDRLISNMLKEKGVSWKEFQRDGIIRGIKNREVERRVEEQQGCDCLPVPLRLRWPSPPLRSTCTSVYPGRVFRSDVASG